MAKKEKHHEGIGLATKLIIVSTALLAVVIGLFGVINDRQSRRIIDDFVARLERKISESLRKAGSAQVQLLAQAVQVALVQSDYVSIQTMVRDMSKKDNRITGIAVVDLTGQVLAHTDPSKKGQQANGPLSRGGKTLIIRPNVEVGGVPSMVFSAPMTGTVEVAEEQDGTDEATVTDKKTMILGHVFMAYSMRPLHTELAAAAKIKQEEVRKSLRKALVVGLGAIVLGLILTILQSLSMSRPLRDLSIQANRMAKGELDARVEIKTKDEIGWLGLQFNDMAQQIRVLVETTKETAAMEKELEVASAVQSTLVPDSSVADVNGLKLAGYFRAATKCGGDWWSYHLLKDGKILIIISDVTGHGVASAMITAAAKGVTNTVLKLSGGRIELPQLLELLHDTIRNAGKGKFAMTCFASIYDPKTSSLSYVNAGHNYPYLVKGGSHELSSLAMIGDRLGDPGEVTFKIDQVQLGSNDTLVWYTDGLVECEDKRGEEFGENRFQTTILSTAHLQPKEAVDRIVRSAEGFYGEVPHKDDITVIVGKIC